MTSGNRLLTLAEARERKRGDPPVTGRLPRPSGPRNVRYLQRVATLLPYGSACREYVAELMNRGTGSLDATSGAQVAAGAGILGRKRMVQVSSVVSPIGLRRTSPSAMTTVVILRVAPVLVVGKVEVADPGPPFRQASRGCCCLCARFAFCANMGYIQKTSRKSNPKPPAEPGGPART